MVALNLPGANGSSALPSPARPPARRRCSALALLSLGLAYSVAQLAMRLCLTHGHERLQALIRGQCPEAGTAPLVGSVTVPQLLAGSAQPLRMALAASAYVVWHAALLVWRCYLQIVHSRLVMPVMENEGDYSTSSAARTGLLPPPLPLARRVPLPPLMLNSHGAVNDSSALASQKSTSS